MKKIALTIFIFGVLASCDSFLDLEPKNFITPQEFPETEQDMEEQLVAVYSHFRGYYEGNNWVFGEFRSDNTSFQFNPNDRGGAAQETVDEFLMNSGNGSIGALWSNSYSGIFRTNILLERADGIEFDDPGRREVLKAEAKFFRAFYYFNMVRMFGDVPLVTETIKSINEIEFFASIGRTSVDSIYEVLIIPDLVSSVDELPDPFTEEFGRVTKGAAYTLLGDVYMTLSEFDSAVFYLEKVAEFGYELQTDYQDVFDPLNKGNEEIIFDTQHSLLFSQGFGLAGGWVPYNSGTDILPVTASTRAGKNQPTQSLIDAYEQFDLRFPVSVGFYKQDPEDTDSVAYPLKWMIDFPTQGAGQELNWPVYRYADVLLLLAEARNQVSGLDNRSIELFNEVRARAGLPAKFPGASNPDLNVTDQQELREAIWKERRIELAFENKRWFDLVRTGRAVEVMEAHGEEEKLLKTTLNPGAYENIRVLIGLPRVEAELYGYDQNDGWD